MLNPKLGIDLGTANILIFASGKGVILSEPSVVALSEQNKKVLAVGESAREMIGKTPDDIVAYRPMQDGVIADYKITEIMLKYFLGKVLGKWNIFRPNVIISVPAGVTSTQRRAVIDAAVNAGARSAHVIKEPILAAIGAGIHINDSRGYMIVDIGGGTIDVAIISLGGIVLSKSVKVAGDKIDNAIVDYMRKKHNLAIGEKTAEKIKRKIGTAIRLEPDTYATIKGRDYLSGLPKTIRISSNELVLAYERELRAMIQAIKDTLADVPPELASDIIDNGIVMSGGTSQLKKFAELVAQKTGVRTTVADDPLFCVARGTGIALDHLDLYKKALLNK